MKETQQDFGLGEGGSIETTEEDARPLYHPLTWERVGPDSWRLDQPPEPPKSLPADPTARKRIPLYSGVLKYFPDALVAVAECSYASNEQHNPGQPMHWNRAKSTDHADCILRHLVDDATGVKIDVAKLSDGTEVPVPHLAKVAWRALALLQTRIEQERGK